MPGGATIADPEVRAEYMKLAIQRAVHIIGGIPLKDALPVHVREELFRAEAFLVEAIGGYRQPQRKD